MCSHPVLTWQIVPNTVQDGMIDRSLMHEFAPAPKIRRRTKILNKRIKNFNVAKSYKDYVKAKTDVLRYLSNDTETDDTESLSDADYSIINNSESMLAKHLDRTSKLYYTSEEEEWNCKRKRRTTNVRSNKSKESSDIEWQQIVNENRSTSRSSGFGSRESIVSNKITSPNSSGSTKSKRRISYITKSNSDSSSDSENTPLSIRIKHVNKRRQNHKYSNAIVNRSHSKSGHWNNATRSVDKSIEQTHGHLDFIDPDYKTALSGLSIPENVNDSVPSINIEDSNRLEDCNTEEIMEAHDGNLIKATDHNDMTLNKSNVLKLQDPDYKIALSGLPSPENVNDSVSSIDIKDSNRLEDCNTEELMEKNDGNLIKATDHGNTPANPNVSKLVDNVKKNLTALLDDVDFMNNGEIKNDQSMECKPDQNQLFLSADLPLHNPVEQQKDSGIDDDSQDKYIKQINSESLDSIKDIPDKISFPCQIKQNDEATNGVEDYIKDPNFKSYILRKDSTERTGLIKTSPPLSESDNESEGINDEDEIHFTELDNLCDVKTKYLQPKVTSTELVYTRYKIKIDTNSDASIKDECSPMKIDTLTDLAVINNDADDVQERITANITEGQEEESSILLEETDNEEEEEDTNHRLLMKKRQANLNLIVESDSSESENEDTCHMITETAKSNADGSETVNHCSDDEKEKSGQENHDSKKNISISCSEDTALDNIGACREEKSENNEEDCISEEHSTSASDNINMHEDISTNDENECNKSNQIQDRINISETHPELTMHPEASCRYRPCNLQELVEDQELFVERLSPSFTLTDLSEDEEAFFLNVPSKILQCDLRGQKLILKEETIKFGQNKYKIKRRKADTVTCIFATNKQKEPYKTVNIKEISTITLQERLSNPFEESYPSEKPYSSEESDASTKSDSPLCHKKNAFFNVRKRRIYSNDDFEMTGEQIDEMELQKAKLVKHQKRRRKNDSGRL